MKMKIDCTIVNIELDLVMRDQHLQLVVEETIGERARIVTYLGKEEAEALHAALGYWPTGNRSSASNSQLRISYDSRIVLADHCATFDK